MKSWKLVLSLILALGIAAHPQDKRAPTSKAATKIPFVCSNFVWTWRDNGFTTFTFSMKNQSGRDVKSVKYRVLFFDRQGSQIDFAEARTGTIPNGLAHRESVDLDFDTGISTRKLSSYQRVEVLGFEQDESP